MQRLGLDANDIKYVVISHAHGDHIGGAEMLQNRGARILMDPVDWDLSSASRTDTCRWRPGATSKRTMACRSRLGDTTVTLWRTPGHTPGTLSFTFTRFRQRPTGQCGVLGGHGAELSVQHARSRAFGTCRCTFSSQQHIAAQAAATQATVLLSNHSEFDNAVNKVKMLPGAGMGRTRSRSARAGAALLRGDAERRARGTDRAGAPGRGGLIAAHRHRAPICERSVR